MTTYSNSSFGWFVDNSRFPRPWVDISNWSRYSTTQGRSISCYISPIFDRIEDEHNTLHMLGLDHFGDCGERIRGDVARLVTEWRDSIITDAYYLSLEITRSWCKGD